LLAGKLNARISRVRTRKNIAAQKEFLVAALSARMRGSTPARASPLSVLCRQRSTSATA